MIVIAWYQEPEPGYIEGPRAARWCYGINPLDMQAALKHIKNGLVGNISCSMAIYMDDDAVTLDEARNRVQRKHDEIKWIKMD